MDSEYILKGKKENITSEVNLDNIKSKNNAKKIFDFISKFKLLSIIKNNKKKQRRLNNNISDYKKYFEIEIELIPIKNKYGKFNNNEDLYFHMYFNDNKEEIDKNYITKFNKVSKIKIIIDYPITSFANLFKY